MELEYAHVVETLNQWTRIASDSITGKSFEYNPWLEEYRIVHNHKIIDYRQGLRNISSFIEQYNNL